MKKPLEQQLREAKKAFKYFVYDYEHSRKCACSVCHYLKLLKKQVRELKKELKNYRQALDYFGNLSAIKSFMKENGIK